MDNDETVLGGGNPSWRKLEPGTRLDNYRIERLLGQGGMGAVYLAEHESLAKQYALKVLPEELSRDTRFRERFQEESRRMAGLSHPGILPIYYAGESEGLHYFAMEYIPGGDLEERMSGKRTEASKSESSGSGWSPLPEREVANILKQLLEALSYAHQQGVIHRDLKPANLLITEEGTLKIADFGLAQVMGENYMKHLVERTVSEPRSAPSGQKSSSFAGTLHFMAPEVVSGEEATMKSDLYAVGVLAYLLLTGKKPIGKYRDVKALIPDADPGWDDWLDQMLDPEPEDRVDSADQALEALKRLKITEDSAGPVSKPEVIPPQKKGSWKRWSVVVLLVILAALGGIFLPDWFKDLSASVSFTGDSLSEEEPEKPQSLKDLPGPRGDLVVQSVVGASVFAVDSQGNRFELGTVGKDELLESRDQLPVGIWSLEIEKTGYKSQKKTGVEIDSSEMNFTQIELLPEPATLILGSSPSGASVRINGETVGVTPRVLESLPVGEPIDLEIRQPGYQIIADRITLEGGESLRLSFDLVEASGGLRLVLENPELNWSQVDLDLEGLNSSVTRQQSVNPEGGSSSLRFEDLDVGYRSISVLHPDYQPFQQEVEVLDGETRLVAVRLQPKLGTLEISTSPEGSLLKVLQEGQVVAEGFSPGTFEVPTGSPLTLEARKEGYQTLVQEIELSPGKSKSLKMGALTPSNGDLEIAVGNPNLDLSKLRIQVNGKPVNPTREGRILVLSDLRLGEQDLRIEYPNYESFSRTVQLSSKETERVDLDLVPVPGTLFLEIRGPSRESLKITMNGNPVNTGGTGGFQITPNQEIELRVEAREWYPVERKLTLLPGETRTVSLSLEPDQGPVPGKPATVDLPGDAEMKLAWIEEGSFMMGSPREEPGRQSDESPQTWVRISEGYWMGVTEVTIEQFRAFTQASGYRTEAEQNSWNGMMIFTGNTWEEAPRRSWKDRFADNSQNPVIGISWNDAVAFCEWLTNRKRREGKLPPGYAYQLPTEAQWEFAARAGTTTRWFFGNDESKLGLYAWYSANAGQETQAVAQKLPNPNGLYDIHGNVWEWTRSWKGDYPGLTTTDYAGPSFGKNRVIRGGSWFDGTRWVRVAFRHRGGPDIRYDNLGFRISLAPVE